jgi:hypothetical protein
MAKETPWLEIKAAFLKGVTAKELAVKYKIKARSITDKAYTEKWNEEKSIINENIRDKIEKQVERITNLALTRLEDVLQDEDVKTSDLVNAIGKAFDISGLKSSKSELTGKDGSALIQKVYITATEKNNTDNHIDSVINEQ